MGQSSSQLAAPASTKSTTEIHEDPDCTSATQGFATKNASSVLKRALSPPIQQAYRANPITSSSTTWSSSINADNKGDSVSFDYTRFSDKMSDSMAMPPPQRDNAGESNWRQDRANRKKQQMQSDRISRLQNEARHMGEQQKVKYGSNDSAGNTDQSIYSNRDLQTPTQTKKRKRGRSSKASDSDRRSSHSSSNCHSSIIDEPSLDISSFRKQANQSPTMNRHIKHEWNVSPFMNSSQSLPATPRNQLFSATRTGLDWSKSAKKRHSRVGRKKEGSSFSGSPTHTTAKSKQTYSTHYDHARNSSTRTVSHLDRKMNLQAEQGLPHHQSKNFSAQHDQENSRRSKNAVRPVVKSRGRKKRTTISELTQYNGNSQRFKSAKIKYDQDFKNASRQAPNQTPDVWQGPLETPLSKKPRNHHRPRVMGVDHAGEEITNQMPSVKLEDEQRDDTSKLNNSLESIITDSRSLVTTSIENINHPTTSYENEVGTEFLPVDENSSEDEKPKEMARNSQDESGHLHTSTIQERVLPSITIRDGTSKKRRIDNTDIDDGQDDADLQSNKKSRLESPQSDIRVSSSESGSSTKHNVEDPHQYNASPNDLAQPQREAQKQTRTSNASRRAYKSAEFIDDSDSDRYASEGTKKLSHTNLVSNQEGSNVDDTPTSMSHSTTPKTTRNLRVGSVRKRKSAARLAPAKSSKIANDQSLPSSLHPMIMKKGAFNQKDKDAILSFKHAHCDIDGLSHLEFVAKLHGNAHNDVNLSAFWTDMQEAIGNRDRKSLQRFCRRYWPQAEMAGMAFTKENDKELLHLVAEHGIQWVKISEIMGRPAEEIRDRYRNVLKDRTTRVLQRWSEEEVIRLRHAVGEVGALALSVTPVLKEHKSLISWGAISAHMQGKRGRSQCAYKWKQLQLKGFGSIGEEVRSANTRLGLNLDLFAIDLNNISITGGGDSVLENQNDDETEAKTPVSTIAKSDLNTKKQARQVNQRRDATQSKSSASEPKAKIKKHTLLRDKPDKVSTPKIDLSKDRALKTPAATKKDHLPNITPEQTTHTKTEHLQPRSNTNTSPLNQSTLKPVSQKPRATLTTEQTPPSSTSDSTSESDEEPTDILQQARRARKLQQSEHPDIRAHAVKMEDTSDIEIDTSVSKSRASAPKGASMRPQNQFIDDEASETGDEDDGEESLEEEESGEEESEEEASDPSDRD